MDIFSKRLKNLRKEKSLTYATVAEAIGIDTKTYWSYENELGEPRQTNLVKIADYFGVSLDYLLGRVEF
ncbi:MAG: helix-turn-helix domain-containing protein [Firmicutes bacterium]|nr:helix-turn-helix domain-containing protein [Bacillota bacterium]